MFGLAPTLGADPARLAQRPTPFGTPPLRVDRACATCRSHRTGPAGLALPLTTCKPYHSSGGPPGARKGPALRYPRGEARAICGCSATPATRCWIVGAGH